MVKKEKIRVFVSSSMNRDEDGHDWMKFREELADQIDCSSVLTSFRIEEHGSPIASEQYYLTKIEQAGIVVSLVCGELRPGTENEIRYAVYLRKPLLFIKIGEQKSRAIKDMVTFLHSVDYCLTVEIDSFENLALKIVDMIEDVLVDLFHGRLFELSYRKKSGVGLGGSEDASMPIEVIDSFGSSQTKLLEIYDYRLDWLEVESNGSLLEALGNAIVDWAVDGEPLSIGYFKDRMLSAMEGSGCLRQVLEHRYNAIDAYLQDDYERAFAEVELARVSVPNKDSWVYGNILIDRRNVSTVAAGVGSAICMATQEEINALNRPVIFPLALKYECRALKELDASQDSKRACKPGSITIDNRVSIALKDVALHMFTAMLYGSIASLMYSRSLLAKVLLGYSDIYDDSKLAFDGLRISLLAGDGSGFVKELDSRFDLVSNYVSSEADALWLLSERTPINARPIVRCILAERCGSYFSDDVFEEAARFLTEDKLIFCRCRDKWIKAINAIKLRMQPTGLTRLIAEVLSERLPVSASTVGSIIRGYPVDQADEKSGSELAAALRNNQEELIEGGIDLTAFAVVEAATGENILFLEGKDFPRIDVAAYRAALRTDCKKTFFKECLKELERQVTKNNSQDMFSHFGRDVVTPICSLVREGDLGCPDEEDNRVLESLLKCISSYRGALSVVDGVLEVCFALKSNQAESDMLELDHLLQIISLDHAQRDLSSFDSFSFDVIECRILALTVIAESREAVKYLSKGVQFSNLSRKAKMAYASSFAQLVRMGYITDDQMEFAKAVALAMGEEKEGAIRKQVIECMAGCSARWGSEYFRDAFFEFVRDPSDDVRFSLLRACMHDDLGDWALSRELYEVLCSDVNWFIRWHATHDKKGASN